MKIFDWLLFHLGTFQKWSSIKDDRSFSIPTYINVGRFVTGQGGVTLNNGQYLTGDIRFDTVTNTLFINTSTDPSNPTWIQLV